MKSSTIEIKTFKSLEPAAKKLFKLRLGHARAVWPTSPWWQG